MLAAGGALQACVERTRQARRITCKHALIRFIERAAFVERIPGLIARLGVVYGAGEGDTTQPQPPLVHAGSRKNYNPRKLTGLTELTGKLSPN